MPRGLTVTVGLPAATASVIALPASPLLSTIQLPGEDTSVSPKIRLPIVRGESRRTIRSSTSSSEEKSAVLPTPAPTIPLSQFGLEFHTTPETVSRVRMDVPPPARGVLTPDAVADEGTSVDLAHCEPAIQRIARDVGHARTARVHVKPHAALARERPDRHIEDAVSGWGHAGDRASKAAGEEQREVRSVNTDHRLA